MKILTNVIYETTKLIGYILLFAAFYLILSRVDTYLKNQAIDTCAKSSSYEVTDVIKSAKITYPVTDVYRNCLKLKGIK